MRFEEIWPRSLISAKHLTFYNVLCFSPKSQHHKHHRGSISHRHLLVVLVAGTWQTVRPSTPSSSSSWGACCWQTVWQIEEGSVQWPQSTLINTPPVLFKRRYLAIILFERAIRTIQRTSACTLIVALEWSHSKTGHIQEQLNNDLIFDAYQPHNEQQA